jgi:DNA-binding transcriptional MerR regulator
MTTRTPTTTTNTETWKDWLGPDRPEPAPADLYSREQIAEMANHYVHPRAKPVKPSDLRLWEQMGILPRGLRRGHQGAARNVYPAWVASLAREIRGYQYQGLPLEEIRPRIRAHALIMLGFGDSETDNEIRAAHPSARAPEDIRLWPDLISELERLARWHTHLTGTDADRVEVHVIGANGRATRYPHPIAAHEPENAEG